MKALRRRPFKRLVNTRSRACRLAFGPKVLGHPYRHFMATCLRRANVTLPVGESTLQSNLPFLLFFVIVKRFMERRAIRDFPGIPGGLSTNSAITLRLFDVHFSSSLFVITEQRPTVSVTVKERRK